jgi:hypothetical protein
MRHCVWDGVDRARRNRRGFGSLHFVSVAQHDKADEVCELNALNGPQLLFTSRERSDSWHIRSFGIPDPTIETAGHPLSVVN